MSAEVLTTAEVLAKADDLHEANLRFLELDVMLVAQKRAAFFVYCYNKKMSLQPPSFEHSALEADIARLAEEIQKHKEAPETKNLSEQDLLRHAIKQFPAPQAPAPVAKGDDSVQSSGFLPSYAEDAPAETKLELEYLIDIAFHGGLAKAVSEARKAPAFVQDALHDALAGKLYPMLREKGILK